MNKKIAAGWVSLAMVLSFIVIIIEIAPIVSAPTTIYVGSGAGNNSASITGGIALANPGDTVFVYSGTYTENVDVDKTINLIGENQETTIIDGSGSGNVIFVWLVDWVNISGFTTTNGNHGIYIWMSDNCTVTNCNSNQNNGFGIFIRQSSNNKVLNCNSSYNIENGIRCWFSEYTIITNGTFNWISEDGMFLWFSENTTILNCNSSYNGEDGIWVSDSNNNTIMNSTSIWNGRSSLFGRGIIHGSSYNTKISNCTCDYNSYKGISASGGKITIENSNCRSNNFDGISFYCSDDNVITGNNISSNDNYGLYFYNSSNYIIMNNNFSNNGILIWGDQLSYFNTHRIPTNNIVNGDPLYYYKNCSGINISGIPIGQLILANCTDFYVGNLEINNTDVGVEIAYSTNIRVKNNEVSSDDYGIILYSSSNNTIKNNNISNNLQGIHVFSSSSNLIYHNNISNNMYQAFDNTNNTNDWDNGYPSGGNYWSDYGGVDNFKGPNQNIPGKDGIGDTPYDIDSDSRDNYPLLEPWKYYMILKQGWNLISLPLIQEERNLTRVLGSIEGWYDAVQWYNLKDTDDPWKHHKINKPYGNDLFEITEKMGSWIHITRPEDTIFLYNGTLPTQNLSVSLNQGWNHVGYPSFTRHNRTKGLNNLTFYNEVNSIWIYSAATQKWKELGPSDYFEPTMGYWIHAKTKCEWEVPL